MDLFQSERTGGRTTTTTTTTTTLTPVVGVASKVQRAIQRKGQWPKVRSTSRKCDSFLVLLRWIQTDSDEYAEVQFRILAAMDGRQAETVGLFSLLDFSSRLCPTDSLLSLHELWPLLPTVP